MRAILFRGKIDPDAYSHDRKSEWVHGYYTRYSVIFFGRSVIEQENDDYAVLDETVCQYIGLNDIKGNQIFENDIVRIGIHINGTFFEANYVCKYDDKRASFRFQYIVPQYVERVNRYVAIGENISMSDIEACYVMEIMGNIFDNPELLNEVKE